MSGMAILGPNGPVFSAGNQPPQLELRMIRVPIVGEPWHDQWIWVTPKQAEAWEARHSP